MDNKFYYVYFLQSLKDRSYYIGVTDNVKRRLGEHNAGLSKSTASKRPWKLVRVEKYPDRKSAYQREYFLKAKKSRKIIEIIIKSKNSPDVCRRQNRDPDSRKAGRRDSVG